MGIIKLMARRLEENADYLNRTLSSYATLSALCCFLIVTCGPLNGQEVLAQGPAKLSRPSRTGGQDIKLELLTSKPTYRKGDPIFIFIYLENVSPRNYYIGKSFNNYNVFTPFHYVELNVVDNKGNDVSGPRIFSHPDVSALSAETVPEKIARRYLLLGPKMIYGLKVYGHISRNPGRYSYTAIYREVDALRWPEAERNALANPVWTQALVSNTVTITVLPGKRSRAKR